MMSKTYSYRSTATPGVEFEYRDGLYWLDGLSLTRLAAAVGLSCQGETAGFDLPTVSLYIRKLRQHRTKVLVRGGEFPLLFALAQRSTTPAFTKTSIAPELIFGERELRRLMTRSSTSSSFGAVVNDWRTKMSDERPLPEPTVFRVAEDMFEVDWELTAFAERDLQALALAAFEAGRPLDCHLVLPKPQRAGTLKPAAPSRLVERVPSFGQLRLAL